MNEAGGYTILPDETLIEYARNEDLAAFNVLVERYQRLVFAVCSRLLLDPQHAEDVTQETFIRAYTALDQYYGGSFRAWLLRIATNRSYDLLRHSQRRPADSYEAQTVESEPQWSSEPLSPDPAQFASRAALSDHLERALAQLPADQRLAVLLHDVHGYPYDEIAETMAVSLGTVKSRLSRGRARLRELIRQDERARELFESVGRHLNSDDVS